MAPIKIDPRKVHAFATPGVDFHAWLKRHHDIEEEVWIKIHKVGSGLASINPKEAIDVALCWGWIDAIRKGFDGKSLSSSAIPGGAKKSIWSQINVANVARLIAEGRMTPHGLTRRWMPPRPTDAGRGAYARAARKSGIPEIDLRAAIEAVPMPGRCWPSSARRTGSRWPSGSIT